VIWRTDLRTDDGRTGDERLEGREQSPDSADMATALYCEVDVVTEIYITVNRAKGTEKTLQLPDCANDQTGV
jgi:hypothetical protein